MVHYLQLMKKTYIFYILFTFCVLNTFAQSQSNSTYSVGLNLFSYGQVPKILDEIRIADSYQSSMFNGLIAKFNDNQISYRFLASRYFKKDYSFYNSCKTCEFVKGKYTSYEFKMGFEKNLIYAQLQPFFGLDLGYKDAIFNGLATDALSKNNLYTAEIQKKGAVFYPFLGLKYTPTTHITISAESGLNLYYNFIKEIKRYPDANKTIDTRNTNDWEVLTQPLGIFSIQYNFGTN